MRLAEVIERPPELRRWGLKLQQMVIDSDDVPDVHVKLKPGRYDDEITLALTHPCIDTYFLLAGHNSVLKLPDPTHHGEFLTGSINGQGDVDHMLCYAVVTSLAAALDGRGYSLKLRDRKPDLIIEFADTIQCVWDVDIKRLVVSTTSSKHNFETVAEAAQFINDY